MVFYRRQSRKILKVIDTGQGFLNRTPLAQALIYQQLVNSHETEKFL